MLTSLAFIYLIGLAMVAVCLRIKLPRIIDMLLYGIPHVAFEPVTHDSTVAAALHYEFSNPDEREYSGPCGGGIFGNGCGNYFCSIPVPQIYEK